LLHRGGDFSLDFRGDGDAIQQTWRGSHSGNGTSGCVWPKPKVQ
jgi:hypothetical protein